MANRFPVIANSNIRRLEELASGDNLDLSGSGIYDGASVGVEGQQLYSNGSGIEWRNQPTEYDTLYSISAVDGDPGKQIIRLTSGGPLASAGNITDDVTLVAGNNVSLSRTGDEITINSSYIDTDTITQLRGNTTGTYVDGQVTLLPQGSVFITQNGNNISIGATDTNTVTQIKGGNSGTFTTGNITFLGTNATSITQNGNTITVDSQNTVTTLQVFGAPVNLTGEVILKSGGATTLSQVGQDITISSVNTTYGIGVTSINSTTKAIRLSGSDNAFFDANLVAGTGISLSSDSNNLTISVDTSNIDLDNLGDVTISLPVDGHVLQYLNGGWINGSLDYSNLANAPSLATVATSGDYGDLINSPSLGTVATSNSYNDLNDLPTLVTDASDLTDTTNRFFSGDYADLTNAPTLATVATSGSYSDLSDSPALGAVATSNSYNDLNDLPIIPPERDFSIEAVTNVNGAAVRLVETLSNTIDDIVLVSGTGISVSQTNDTAITIASTITGIPSGVTINTTGISFEGSNTTDGYSTTLAVINPTANRTLSLPNANGTIVIDSTNKTYSIDVSDADTNYYESKLGLLGSNTGGTTYSTITGKGGLRVDLNDLAGGVQSSAIKSLTIEAPPTVYTGSTAPAWAKEGDLWYNNSTGILRIFDESLYPVGGTILNYFQSVDTGEARFFADRLPPATIPTSGFVVGPGIPTGANIISNFQGNSTSAGWFNLSATVTTNIPHNARLRLYSTNQNFNINNLWRVIYSPVAAKRYLQNRTEITGTTQELADGSGENISITGPKTYALLSITTNVPAWITFYTDATSRNNDANRSSATSPVPNTGIIADIHTTNLNSTIRVSPGLIGWTDDNSNSIPIRVVNESGIVSTVEYSIKVLQLQGED